MTGDYLADYLADVDRARLCIDGKPHNYQAPPLSLLGLLFGDDDLRCSKCGGYR